VLQHGCRAGFAAGEDLWVERLGNLRNAVRHELIARQLGAHVQDGASVLDVGCGQGTQAIRLARRSCAVFGVDPSTERLAGLAADAHDAGVHAATHQGRIDDLAAMLGHRTFDVVCAHVLLMYLDDLEVALTALAARLAPAGLLSITFRNGLRSPSSPSSSHPRHPSTPSTRTPPSTSSGLRPGRTDSRTSDRSYRDSVYASRRGTASGSSPTRRPPTKPSTSTSSIRCCEQKTKPGAVTHIGNWRRRSM
jgi:SAM-dependent methyltransferase